jgi:hypothetical protein
MYSGNAPGSRGERAGRGIGPRRGRGRERIAGRSGPRRGRWRERAAGGSGPRAGAGRGRERIAGQLVTSAEVKRAQAKEPDRTTYTANDSRPLSRVEVSTGTRSIASNDNHQCVGRYGPMAASCGT